MVVAVLLGLAATQDNIVMPDATDRPTARPATTLTSSPEDSSQYCTVLNFSGH